MDKKKEAEVMGAALCRARIAANLSLVEVSLVLKRNKGTISKWERGIDRPSIETLQRLALLYKTDDFIPKPPKGIAQGVEVWKPVAVGEYGKRYVVSNYGRVAKVFETSMDLVKWTGQAALTHSKVTEKFEIKDLVSRTFLGHSEGW